MSVNSSASAFYGYEALVGIGAGAYTQANFAVVQANVDPKDAGAGITLMLTGNRTSSFVYLASKLTILLNNTDAPFYPSSTLRSIIRPVDCGSHLSQRRAKIPRRPAA